MNRKIIIQLVLGLGIAFACIAGGYYWSSISSNSGTASIFTPQGVQQINVESIKSSEQNNGIDAFSGQIIDHIKNDQIRAITKLYPVLSDFVSYLNSIEVNNEIKTEIDAKLHQSYSANDQTNRLIKYEQKWNTLRDEISEKGLVLSNMEYITTDYEADKTSGITDFNRFDIIFKHENVLYKIKTNGAIFFNDKYYLKADKLKFEQYDIDLKKNILRNFN